MDNPYLTIRISWPIYQRSDCFSSLNLTTPSFAYLKPFETPASVDRPCRLHPQRRSPSGLPQTVEVRKISPFFLCPSRDPLYPTHFLISLFDRESLPFPPCFYLSLPLSTGRPVLSPFCLLSPEVGIFATLVNVSSCENLILFHCFLSCVLCWLRIIIRWNRWVIRGLVMLVLFETPAGFALFKVLDEGKLDKVEVMSCSVLLSCICWIGFQESVVLFLFFYPIIFFGLLISIFIFLSFAISGFVERVFYSRVS